MQRPTGCTCNIALRCYFFTKYTEIFFLQFFFFLTYKETCYSSVSQWITLSPLQKIKNISSQNRVGSRAGKKGRSSRNRSPFSIESRPRSPLDEFYTGRVAVLRNIIIRVFVISYAHRDPSARSQKSAVEDAWVTGTVWLIRGITERDSSFIGSF